MPKFSARSLDRLHTCRAPLIELFTRVVIIRDCTILEGHRSPERQLALYEAIPPKTKVKVGGHNSTPSDAVDVAPWPIPEKWGDHPNPKVIGQFYHFGGLVLGVAAEMNIPIRWGGDWDGDHDFRDQKFDDLVHFEMKD